MTPLVVFAYDFPHKKTQDVLLRLFCLGYPVGLVIASEPVSLNIPSPSIRTKIRHSGLLHPRTIAEKLRARYVVAPHNSHLVADLLDEYKPTLGVIAGARILKEQIISKFSIGIVNLHPGLIPEVRGLDSMLWSIYYGVPVGVTAHLIDSKIDAGRILLRQRVPVYADDTLLDLSERLYDEQVALLDKALPLALEGKWFFPEPDLMRPPNRKMPAALEEETVGKFETYKRRFAEGEN